MFNKICKTCKKAYQSKSRNKANCEECSAYKPKEGGRQSKYRFNRGCVSDVDLWSYFVGFLFGDGSAQETLKGELCQVGWYSSEKYHVETITEMLGYEGPVYPVSSKGAGEWGNSFWADNARELKKYGIRKNKDLMVYEPSMVSLYPFLRGLLDSDGTIKLRDTSFGKVISHVGFLVRKNWGDQLIDELKKEGFDPSLYQEGSIWNVVLGSTNAERLLERMYQGSGLRLERKFRTYQEAMLIRQKVIVGL